MDNKFVDRLPIICAAGKVNDPGEDLTDYFKSYTQDEAAQYITTKRKRNARLKRSTPSNDLMTFMNTPGDAYDPESYNSVKLLMEPTLQKFRFKEFEETFFENLYYQSARRGPLGKTSRMMSLPDGVTNESYTFGAITPKSPGIFYLRKQSDILREAQLGHARYLISHSSYYPSEQVSRHYDGSGFNKTNRFGILTKPDVTGEKTKQALEPHRNSTFCIMNIVQDKKLKKDRTFIAKPLKKQDLNIDPDFIYGHTRKKDKFTGKQMIQSAPLCPQLEKLYESIAHLNNKRRQFKHRRDFYFIDVEVSLRAHDVNKTGILPWVIVYNVMRQHYVSFDLDKLKFVSSYYGIVDEANENVEYDKFLKLLMTRYPLPKFENLFKHEKIDRNVLTTYREACTDHIRHPVLPEVENNTPVLMYPRRININCKADLEELGNETSMSAVITPSIQTQIGISHRDYLLPRSEEDIRIIFKPLIANLKPEDFTKIWNQASKQISSRNGTVSVEAFKFCLDVYNRSQSTVCNTQL